MKKAKIVLFFTIFLIFSTCINVVHPITTAYVETLKLPEAYFGIFYSLMALGQVAGAFLWGWLSDKIGRKWIIVSGIIGYCLAQAGFGFINQWPWLICLFRIFSGVFASAPVTLFPSMCLDMSNKDNKLKYLSILGFCSTLGIALGSEIGGSIYDYLTHTFESIFLIQIGVGVFSALLFAIFINDIKKTKENNQPIKETQDKAPTQIQEKKLSYINVFTLLLLAGVFVLNMGQIGVQKYTEPYVYQSTGSTSTLGHYMCITGVISAFANLLFIPLIKKVKDKKLAILLTAFVGISGCLVFITFGVKANVMIMMYTTNTIYMILKSLIVPLEQNELALYSNGSNNGKLMGARQTMLSIAKVLGPVIGIFLYKKGSSLIFYISGGIILLSLMIYIAYFIIKYTSKPQQKTNE